MVIASFAEVVSIGAVMPFLAVLMAPEQVFESQLAQPVIEMLQFTDPSQLLITFASNFFFYMHCNSI